MSTLKTAITDWVRLKVQGSTPATPATGYGVIYDKNGSFAYKNAAGTETIMGAGGDVVGPASATDGHMAVFDGTTGKLVKDGGVPGAGSGLIQTSTVNLSSGDLTTTSTTFVDATGLSITLTTGARRCLVSFTGTIKNSSTTNLTALDVLIDSTRMGQAYGLIAHQGTNYGPATFTVMTDVLSAGSHTFKIQFRRDGGTATLYASTTMTSAIFTVTETNLTS